MGLLTTALADGDGRSRLLTWALEVLRHPVMMVRNLSMHRWSEQTIAALVMQSRDNSMTCYTTAGVFRRRLTSKQGHGEPKPDVDPDRPRRSATHCQAHRWLSRQEAGTTSSTFR